MAGALDGARMACTHIQVRIDAYDGRRAVVRLLCVSCLRSFHVSKERFRNEWQGDAFSRYTRRHP